MQILSSKVVNKPKRPIKIMQFGEGNFLRAFTDYFVQEMNDKNVINSDIVVVQPLQGGRVADIAKQDGLYTLCMEGLSDGKAIREFKVIDVLGDFINPYTEYQRLLDYAKSEDLQIIVSNTTEAGIVLDKDDINLDSCPSTYPSKLLAILWTRYNHFKGDKGRGLVIIPCELIDYNGEQLKAVLLELARVKNLDGGFIDWINNCNYFCNTLVDRIVPGYPKEQAQDFFNHLGYIDNNIVKSEVFHLWVLQNIEAVKEAFPVHKIGKNIIFADDISPYKQQKVKILNGGHTALVPVAYLYGVNTVGEALKEQPLCRFLTDFLFDDVVPTIDLPKEQLVKFTSSVLERFQNPFIRHELMSIALNSISKFKSRLLPTLMDSIEKNCIIPNRLLFSFATLMYFYRGKRGNEDIKLNDDAQYLKRFSELWSKHGSSSGKIVQEVFGFKDIWGVDLNLIHADMAKITQIYLQSIMDNGVAEAIKSL